MASKSVGCTRKLRTLKIVVSKKTNVVNDWSQVGQHEYPQFPDQGSLKISRGTRAAKKRAKNVSDAQL